MTRDSDTSVNGWSPLTRVFVLVIILLLLAVLALEVRPLIAPLIISGILVYILNLAVRFLNKKPV